MVLALLLACGAAALAGCGVEKTVDPVAAAATKTVNAGGVKVAMTLGVVGPGGQTVDVAANGVFDQDAADVTVDASSLLAAGNLPSTDGSIEVRYLKENGDSVLYLTAPSSSSMFLIAGGVGTASISRRSVRAPASTSTSCSVRRTRIRPRCSTSSGRAVRSRRSERRP